MPKRVRTNQRFEELYEIAVSSGDQNWPWSRTTRAIEDALARNPDLVDDKATETARQEAYTMADPQLWGKFPAIRDLATRIMDAQPAGTSKRFYHEFMKICRTAVKHPRGVDAALQAVKAMAHNWSAHEPLRP